MDYKDAYQEDKEEYNLKFKEGRWLLGGRVDQLNIQLDFIKRVVLAEADVEVSKPLSQVLIDDTEYNLRSAREDTILNSLYLAFEDKYRGSESLVSKRLSVYIPWVRGGLSEHQSTKAIDIGCGRGEWLALMQDLSVDVIGIDSNSMAVEHCQEKGFVATIKDALLYLQSLDTESVDLITAFHLIEHLSTENFYSLLMQIVRVLKPGGCIIFETPNPANILVSSYDFYRDPSHIKPVHPDTLRFLMRSFGCSEVKSYGVIHDLADGESKLSDTTLHSLDTIQDYVSAPRDFCLIAKK